MEEIKNHEKIESDLIDSEKEVQGSESQNDAMTEVEYSDRVSRQRFMAIGIPLALYAFLFGICLYKNDSGIVTIFVAVATVLCICYCAKKTGYGENAMKKEMYPYYAGIVLLGISTCCTADSLIISVNYIGIFLLVLCALIRIVYEEQAWGVRKYVMVLIELILSPIAYLARPFQDYGAYRRSGEHKKRDVVKYVLIGIVLAVPFLAVIILLLASADAVFSEMVNAALKFIDVDMFSLIGDGVGIILFILAVFVYIYAMCVRLLARKNNDYVSLGHKFHTVIGITFTGMLTAVYLIFSGIQILYLFSNSMELPDGYTYSEYAREGFFQLLVVACINLLIVLFCARFFDTSKVLNMILTVMSACTYVMIASSAMRMLLYIQEFHLTYLRIQVLLVLLVLTFVMGGVMISIYRKTFPLIHYTILTVGVIWILFSFSRPESIIANYNISRFEVVDVDENGVKTVDVALDDLRYLSSLGEDAAPAICGFAEEIADGRIKIERWEEQGLHDMYAFYFEDVKETWMEKPGIRSFNFSRYRAYRCAKRIGEIQKQIE